MGLIPDSRFGRLPFAVVMRRAFFFACCLYGTVSAEPVVIIGAQVPSLLGTRIAALRMLDATGAPIPFQVDERTADGEYVCDRGDEPNSASGNGLLDSADEIVFLREDCGANRDGSASGVASVNQSGGCIRYPVVVGAGSAVGRAYITADRSVGLSPVRYISYDHSTQLLETPAYYAQFGRDRFHFIRAGIRGDDGKSWIHLTRELRVEIYLRALWGALPLHYTEDNLVCFVKRYKAGPVRLIRRGDFHLNIGFGLRGSRAAVNQLCYPRMVSVPVSVHLPVRFKHFFRDAWLEMSPVIDRAGQSFIFSAGDSRCGFSARAGGPGVVDTLIGCPPDRTPFSLLDGGKGFGWMLSTDIPGTSADGNGFVFRRPSPRKGCADCGYKLMIRDVPRGRYRITNWVGFALGAGTDIVQSFNELKEPAPVRTGIGVAPNRLVDKKTPHGADAARAPRVR